MGLRIVRNLVAHACLKGESATIFKLGVKLTRDAKKKVTFGAPVICDIAWRVLDHTDSNRAELLSAPIGGPSVTFVLDGF